MRAEKRVFTPTMPGIRLKTARYKYIQLAVYSGKEGRIERRGKLGKCD